MDRETVSAGQNAFLQRMAAIVAGEGRGFDGDDPWWAIAATQPRPAEPPEWQGPPAAPPAQKRGDARPEVVPGSTGEFLPLAPESLEATELSESQIEALVLKFLANRATATGREIAEQIKLPLRTIEGLLRRLKEERLVVYKGAAPMSDYLYELTELGAERARRYSAQSTYFGAAPVSLEQYNASVLAQTVRKHHPNLERLREVFADLVLGDEILRQLGQAIRSGLGLFLHGAPGNGKTSIAERATRAFGTGIWIPRAVSALGEIIRVYDPSSHELLDPQECSPRSEAVDRRWVRIRRPTIVAGGELTLANLELTFNRATGLSEAPLQMKSNGGTLVIDDFGRQRITPAELLNRWIIPLEKRHDYLNLASGRKIQVQFDQLIIFSTNLEPRALVDEAFLRRIPYKIDVKDPSEGEFRALLKREARAMGVEYAEGPADYLLETHYRAAGRPMRCCHPRDLLHQVRVFCEFLDRSPAMSHEAIDAAVKNYFAMM